MNIRTVFLSLTLAVAARAQQSTLGEGDSYAWAANVGWLELIPQRPAPGDGVIVTDTLLSGFAWSDSTGWINLGTGILKTDSLCVADADHDGISDAWEISYAESTNLFTATSDTDGDGVSDLNEYRADTSPMDATDKLDILDFIRGSTASTLTWTSRPTRLYRIGQSTDLAAWLRSDSFAPDAGDSTTRLTRHDPGPRRFFKVEAVLPLQK